MTSRQALILRELARATGYVPWRQLADAAYVGGKDENCRQVMVQQAVRALKDRWGAIIEARMGPWGGYRLTQFGRRQLGRGALGVVNG